MEQIRKIVQQNFSRWNDALKTRDPKKVTALYAKDATFLPTVSGEFKKGKKGVKEYFEHFLKKNPLGKIVDEKIQILGADCYLHSGLYNFELVEEGESRNNLGTAPWPKGNRKLLEARFSFVWRKNKRGKWEIIHHHSSIRPKE